MKTSRNVTQYMHLRIEIIEKIIFQQMQKRPLTKSITCPPLGIRKTSKKLEVVDTYLSTINTHDKPITNIK